MIHAELAGIDTNALCIAFQKGQLVIQGTRPLSSEMQSATIHCIEQMYGTFERAFFIPAAVDVEHITATYEYGILNVTLPKQPETSVQHVTVPITFIRH